jgi:hypothetical protein
MGRFMSPDWSAKVEPVPYAKLGNPQSLNLYAYVMNNPMTRFDADGHFGCNTDECAAIQKARNNGASQEDALRAAQAQQTNGRQPDGSFKAPTGPGSDIYKRTHGGKNKPIGEGQCVNACREFSGTPPSSQWTFTKAQYPHGRHAMELTDADIGLAIATPDSSGHYPSDSDPLGKNSAIYMGSGYGGIWVVDQWPANPDMNRPNNVPPFLHFIPNYPADNTRHPSRADNADAYYVIFGK